MRVLLSLVLILTAFQTSAKEHAVDVIVQGGYNDNIFLHQDGSAAKRSSLYSRLLGIGWMGWERGDDDRFYIFAASDSKLMTASSQATSSFFSVGPGYRSYHLDQKLEADVNFQVQGNLAGDKAENEDIIRTRSPRTGSPHTTPGSFTSSLTFPSSYFAFVLEGSTLYKFPGFRLGPVVHVSQRNYQKVRHQDNVMRAHLRGEIPIGPSFQFSAEAGKANTGSNVDAYIRTDSFALVSLNLDIGSGFLLAGDYQYENRDFTEAGRKDTISSFHVGVEKALLRDFALLFDLYVFDNNSSDLQYKYSSNLLTLGLKWMAF